MLERQPALSATTLFEAMQERHPGRFGAGQKRTFQRRVKAWKALHGPDKEVMFRQVQVPGRQGLSDFTELKGCTVTIGGVVLEHRLYHFRLAYSGWSHVRVVRFNRRCAAALSLERAHLQALPARRTTDYGEQVVLVSSSATIEVKRVLYSVPARLIGERLRLHLYDDRIDAYVGATHAVTLARVYSVQHPLAAYDRLLPGPAAEMR